MFVRLPKTVAFCTNKCEYWQNNCQKKEKCNYPGMRWLSLLYEALKEKGIDFISSDVAVELVKLKQLRASDLFVIQEENAKHAKWLLENGSQPFLLYSWESPIYASFFYDRLKSIAPKFENRLFFDFAFKNFSARSGKNHKLYFPTFSKEDKFYFKDWSKRDFLVMVSANKSANRKITQNKTLKELVYHFYKYLSPTFRSSIKHELHHKRVEAILHFKDRLKVYGVFWDDLSNFDESTKTNLKPIIDKIQPTFCENKIETISNYKFCICAENVEYDGYVTEKIIDCFIAGTIPIYFGTSKISKMVPKDIYIDFIDFNDFDELDRFLCSMSEEKAKEMIQNAYEFLKSDRGKKFSNEYFVENIVRMIE